MHRKPTLDSISHLSTGTWRANTNVCTCVDMCAYECDCPCSTGACPPNSAGSPVATCLCDWIRVSLNSSELLQAPLSGPDVWIPWSVTSLPLSHVTITIYLGEPGSERQEVGASCLSSLEKEGASWPSLSCPPAAKLSLVSLRIPWFS